MIDQHLLILNTILLTVLVVLLVKYFSYFKYVDPIRNIILDCDELLYQFIENKHEAEQDDRSIERKRE